MCSDKMRSSSVPLRVASHFLWTINSFHVQYPDISLCRGHWWVKFINALPRFFSMPRLGNVKGMWFVTDQT